MIRLSRLADYAVVLMTHIAASKAEVHNAVEVAAATGLPPPTVAKVLKALAHGGLLQARRGARGGYVLSRPADTLTVAEIVSAIDGPIALTHCVKPGAGNCEVERACPSRSGLNRINTAIRTALEAVTLAELVPPPSNALRALAAEARVAP
jgi:FeS assembly SUF system regulator